MSQNLSNLWDPKNDILVAFNRKAEFDFFLEKPIVAGIALQGSEIKSVRSGVCSIQEAYCILDKGEVFIVNLYIGPYGNNAANLNNRKSRKLLLTSREIKTLGGKIAKKGMTIIPIQLFLKKNSLLKVVISLASHKKKTDKRRIIIERDLKREESRSEER